MEQRQAMEIADDYLLLVGQDSIGGPPGLSVAEKDGQVVAIKLFMDDDELDEGTPFDSQPGKVVF